MSAAPETNVSPATLVVASGNGLEIERESDLIVALEGLMRLATGQSMKLYRGPKHYIEAVRHGDFWSVSTRNGGFFTLASFTAEMSTDYCARMTKASQSTGPIWRRIANSVRSPSPERAISTVQVVSLFSEFFSNRKFSLAQSGA